MISGPSTLKSSSAYKSEIISGLDSAWVTYQPIFIPVRDKDAELACFLSIVNVYEKVDTVEGYDGSGFGVHPVYGWISIRISALIYILLAILPE